MFIVVGSGVHHRRGHTQQSNHGQWVDGPANAFLDTVA